MKEDIEEFVKKLDFTDGKYNIQDVFKDIVSLEVCFINATMLFNRDYAKKFDSIMKKYTVTEQNEIYKILIDLAELYRKQEGLNDVMLEILIELGLEDTSKFSNLDKHITLNDNETKKKIKDKGYVGLTEPNSGTGRMILAFARKIQQLGYNKSRNLCVLACEKDLFYTYMIYLQLSMYDIPAIIVSQKRNFTLFTPSYYVFRKIRKTKQKESEKSEIL